MTDLFIRYPQLEACRTEIEHAAQLLINCYQQGGKLLLCGNGGSYSDCLHIVGELMKGFRKKRTITTQKRADMLQNMPSLPVWYLDKLQMALPAIALGEENALSTAFCNDVEPELCFAQQVIGYGSERDVLMCISTSGNSKNVIAAATVAKSLGIQVIGLTGKQGGMLRDVSDACICVPEQETYRVQELHLPVYHALCIAIEDAFFAQ